MIHPSQMNNSQVVPLNDKKDLFDIEQTPQSKNLDVALFTECNQIEKTSAYNEIESIDLSTATEVSANETFHMIRNRISK